jgi:hypothetical protein
MNKSRELRKNKVVRKMAFCPFCGKNVSVDNIVRETSNKFFKSRDEIMYSCPFCKRILSMGLD